MAEGKSLTNCSLMSTQILWHVHTCAKNKQIKMLLFLNSGVGRLRANFPESPYFIIKTSSKGEGNGGESASETGQVNL